MNAPGTEDSNQPPQASAREAVRILHENFLVLAVCLALGVACGFFAQRTIPKAYESRARFVVNEIPYQDLQAKMDPDAEQTLVQTLILSIPSRDMRDEVARRLDVSSKQIAFTELDLPLKLTGAVPEANLRVASTDKSRMGEIVATSQSPEFAASAANAVLDNLQLFNLVGGRLNNLGRGIEVAKRKLDGTVKQLVDISSQRGKLEYENAELDEHVKRGLPLRDFPAFAEDGTLNNLKTQLILVESEYSGLAATSTRGPRIEAKRAEREKLIGLLQAHVERLAGALRSAYAIAKTQQQNLAEEVKDSKGKLDQMAGESARLAQTLNNPAAMRAIAVEAGAPPAGEKSNIIIAVDRAVPRLKPKRPMLWLNLLLGVVFGAGLGGGITILRVLLDNRLRSARQIEERTGQPCLAMLPPLDPIRKTADGFDRPRSPIGLGYLRSHLLRRFLDTKESQIFGFAPARRSDNVSQTVATLGILLVQAGHRVLVVDLYRKSPHIAAALGAKEGTGLSRWLASNEPLENYIERAALRDLGVLGFGKASRELDNMLGRRPISMELPALLKEWDFILIASAALRFDWTMMLTLPPGSPIIITADYRNARADDVAATVQRARNTRWSVEGVVLQNCPERLASSKSL